MRAYLAALTLVAALAWGVVQLLDWVWASAAAGCQAPQSQPEDRPRVKKIFT